MKKFKYSSIALIFILLLIGAFASGFLYSTYVHQNIKVTKNYNLSLIKEALARIDETYYENPSKSKLINGAIKGIIEALDNPYASYYPPKEYKHFKTSMSGNYSGIGVVIGGKKGHINVVKVFNGSPASKKKMKKDDFITAIDNHSTKDMNVEQAAELIKGEEGTTVKLTLKNAGKKRTVKIVRAQISFPNISSKIYGKIGYISMHFFTSGASEKLAKEILILKKKGVNSLIFDLRSNPGGQLNEAVNVASLFIKKGVIVKTKNKKKDVTTYSATGGKIFNGKLIILTSKNTASASEIVAGAIQDRHRGKVVGVKSFGKGTVQQVVDISNNGALVIPSEKWLTPKGRDITKKGITPDIIIKAGTTKIDKQLEKAKELLN